MGFAATYRKAGSKAAKAAPGKRARMVIELRYAGIARKCVTTRSMSRRSASPLGVRP